MAEVDRMSYEEAWQVLGAPADADDEALRAAYLEKVRQHPPDRDPEMFERIRDAYDQVRDPHRRAERIIAGEAPAESLASLAQGIKVARQFVGPEPWLAALKELKEKSR